MGMVIFISYATKDTAAFQIRRIAEQLSQYPEIGKVLFWEKDAHGSIIQYMNENVPKCDIFLLFCSENSQHSDPMRAEWETAQYRGKKIIPIFTSIDYVPPLLQRLRGIRFQANALQGTIKELYQEIVKIIEQPAETHIAKPTDKEILNELEKVTGGSIPSVATLKWNTVGVQFEGDAIIGLGLYKCGLRTLPESFGQLQSLQTLNLGYNRIATLPESFGNLQSLQTLNLGYNRITTLPESFDALKSLQNLKIFSNKLTTLPESFGKLQSLHTLTLRKTKLTTLPASFGQLKSLREVILSENQLNTLPESFGELVSLRSLNLSSNQLNTLPESFGQLKSLLALQISSNKLTIFPESLTQLSNLEILDISDNPLDAKSKEFFSSGIKYVKGNMKKILDALS